MHLMHLLKTCRKYSGTRETREEPRKLSRLDCARGGRRPVPVPFVVPTGLWGAPVCACLPRWGGRQVANATGRRPDARHGSGPDEGETGRAPYRAVGGTPQSHRGGNLNSYELCRTPRGGLRRSTTPHTVRPQDVFDAAARADCPAQWIWDGVHPRPQGHDPIARNWLWKTSAR